MVFALLMVVLYGLLGSVLFREQPATIRGGFFPIAPGRTFFPRGAGLAPRWGERPGTGKDRYRDGLCEWQASDMDTEFGDSAWEWANYFAAEWIKNNYNHNAVITELWGGIVDPFSGRNYQPFWTTTSRLLTNGELKLFTADLEIQGIGLHFGRRFTTLMTGQLEEDGKLKSFSLDLEIQGVAFDGTVYPNAAYRATRWSTAP